MSEKTIVWMEIHAPDVVAQEDALLPDGFRILRPKSRTDEAEHLSLLAQADYVIAGGIPIPRNYLQAAPHLKMIQKWGIGVDKIDCQAAKELGIAVSITAGANSIPVAELAVGLMLAVNRRIPYVDRQMRQGRWLKTEMRPVCYMLHGKTVGLLGIGNIARQVAKMLQGFSVQILYHDISPLSKEQESELHVQYADLDTLLRTSDVLSIHVPLTSDTRGMIGQAQLAQMKSTAILVNTARGGVVDETALARALESGTIRGAGLDSYESEPLGQDSPLLRLDNVVLTSHNGGGVIDNVSNVTAHAYRNITDHAAGHPLDPRDVVVPVKDPAREAT